MTNLLENPIFHDEAKAREWLEARVWANGKNCPHCGNDEKDKITKLEGKAHRPGLYQCNGHAASNSRSRSTPSLSVPRFR